MGNAESNVSSAVKKQADSGGSLKIYSLVNVKGGGDLVQLMKDATKAKEYDTVSFPYNCLIYII